VGYSSVCSLNDRAKLLAYRFFDPTKAPLLARNRSTLHRSSLHGLAAAGGVRRRFHSRLTRQRLLASATDSAIQVATAAAPQPCVSDSKSAKLARLAAAPEFRPFPGIRHVPQIPRAHIVARARGRRCRCPSATAVKRPDGIRRPPCCSSHCLATITSVMAKMTAPQPYHYWERVKTNRSKSLSVGAPATTAVESGVIATKSRSAMQAAETEPCLVSAAAMGRSFAQPGWTSTRGHLVTKSQSGRAVFAPL